MLQKLLLLAAGALALLTQQTTMAIATSPLLPRQVLHGANQVYVPGQLLVKYKPTSTASLRVASMQNLGALHLETLGGTGFEHVHLRSGSSVEDAMVEFQNDPSVESVQPNYYYHTLNSPNDPQYIQQWSLKNDAQAISNGKYATHNPGMADDDMSLEKAWDLSTDCSKVVVAIVDSGINYKHEDLASNMWSDDPAYPNHGYNFVDNNNDPMDLNGHGSHVAGIIGAVGNNGIGIAGICWKAKLMAIRALDSSGAGSTTDIVKGLSFAAQHGAQVVNLSIGTSQNDPAMQATIQQLNDQGIVIVAAAGNESNDNDGAKPSYPCNYNVPNLLCVAALDQSFELATFSNFGQQSVHVGAPGTNILSSVAGAKASKTASFQTNGIMNWQSSGGAWSYGKRTFKTNTANYTFDMLLNPANWDGASQRYAHNLDARTWKSFDLSGVDSAQARVSLFYDIAAGDVLNVATSPTASDPFSSGMLVDQVTGSTGSTSASLSYDLTGCRGPNCTLGFQLKTSANSSGLGAGIFDVTIDTLKLAPNSYDWYDGTSMAAPHVTGVVALLLAYNPSYLPSDAISAIKNGGRSVASLAGKTTTGRAVNAFGSLSFIAAPAGVQAVSK